MNIYEAKVRMVGTDKKGNPKLVNRSYIVTDESFANVEATLLTFAVSVLSISLSGASTIIGTDEADEKSEVYNSVVVLKELGEDGSMKETKMKVFVWAHSTEEANNVVKGWMSENMYIHSVSNTNFMDIL